MDIKIALENNFKVLKEPLLKMAIDHIEELEEENKKLKKRCDNYEETISKMEKVACDICKETAKDRELAELKKGLSVLNASNSFNKEQLNRAKEHIENLLYYVKQCNCDRSNYEEIEKDIKEAEAFLKEE